MFFWGEGEGESFVVGITKHNTTIQYNGIGIQTLKSFSQTCEELGTLKRFKA